MTVSRLTLLLASTACLASPGDVQRTGDQPGGPLAAVAGDYYFGDGLGVNCALTLKAEGRFTFGWRGCLGVYDQNTGGARVVVRNQEIGIGNRLPATYNTPRNKAFQPRRYHVPAKLVSEAFALFHQVLPSFTIVSTRRQTAL